jgi:isocitrate/isopropylmalate dehydrogenase
MLEWLGREKKHKETISASRAIIKAVERCLTAGEVTPDLGGKLSTTEMCTAVKRQLNKVIAS